MTLVDLGDRLELRQIVAGVADVLIVGQPLDAGAHVCPGRFGISVGLGHQRRKLGRGYRLRRFGHDRCGRAFEPASAPNSTAEIMLLVASASCAMSYAISRFAADLQPSSNGAESTRPSASAILS